MLDWIRKRPQVAHSQPMARPEVVPRQEDCRGAGRYRSLCQYLEHRYADTVVLTFGQIEDLLGFALPDLARTQQEWWTATDTPSLEPACTHAWRLASRTATPNLGAKTVVFERIPV